MPEAEEKGRIVLGEPRSTSGWRRLDVRWLAMSLVLFGVLASGAEPAEAGTYTAWYCRDASSRGVGLRDWTQEISGIGYVTTSNVSCPVGGDGGSFGPLVLPDSRNDANSVSDGYAILAPPDVRLDTIRLSWAGGANANGQVSATATNGAQETILASYTNTTFGALPGAAGPDAIYPLAGARGVALRARCQAACQDGDQAFAWYSVYRVALSISDFAAPQGRATGNLLVDPVLKGLQSVSVEGRDAGAGVYQAQVVVDGQVRASAGFADAPCTDVDTSDSDPLEFSAAQPCPRTASTTVGLQTAELAEDVYHHIVVQLIDAAGNATALADRIVGVDNAPLPAGFFDPATRRFANPAFDMSTPRMLNGVGAAADARLRVYLPVRRRVHDRRNGPPTATRARGRRTIAFGSRATIRGVLTDASDRPIANAAVWTASRIQGAEWRISGRPRMTSRRGRIGFHLPSNAPSRQVNLVYFPYSDSHDEVVGRPVVLKVRAGVSLRTDRRIVRNGQPVTFLGRVAGPIPAGGATVALQAKVGRRFRTFRQVRVTAASTGRFATRYRFTATTRTTRYRFRAVVLKQAGLPYETGSSRVATVVVQA
jgi:hypothetical protein